MQLPVFAQAFLDGFSLSGLFGPARRPGAPEYLFAQSDQEEGEADATETNTSRVRAADRSSSGQRSSWA
jgi:hypothetical protein